MARNIDYAARARALVGTRFRAQGRSAEGLDCLGLMLATYAIGADEVRRDYRLGDDHEGEILAAIGRWFRRVRAVRPGDALLFRVDQRQIHFAVRSEHGLIHAHAGLKRVVETPGEPGWTLLGAYRRRAPRN